VTIQWQRAISQKNTDLNYNYFSLGYVYLQQISDKLFYTPLCTILFSPEANKQLTCSHFNYGCIWKHSTQVGVVKWRKRLGTSYMPSPCFTPICFMLFWFNGPCQFTQFLNLCPLIFGLMAFGWLCTDTLTNPLLMMGIPAFLCLFNFCALFRNMTMAWNTSWVYCIMQ